jgi:sulfate transport system permease protein
VLHEIGDEQEQAARTLGANGWQTFWRITLPAIRWGVSYGRRHRHGARARGVRRGRRRLGPHRGQTQTATIWISRRFQRSNTGAYSARWCWPLIASRSWSQ